MINKLAMIVKKGILIFLSLLLSTSQLYSQELSNKVDLNLGADFMSRYVWRGIDFGRSPSIQPYLSLKTGKLEFGAWGAFTTNGLGVQETDLYATFSILDNLSITITDYFFPNDELDENNYFDYSNDSTDHILEALV